MRGRRAVRRGGQPAAWQLLEPRVASIAWSWLRADSWAGTALQDRVQGSHTFTQAGAAATLSSFAGKPCLVCNGTQLYPSSLAAASWAFSADGSGYDCYAVYRATSHASARVLYGSTSSAAQGISHYMSGSSVMYDIHNGATDAVTGSVIGTNTLNTLSWSRISHATARSPQRYGQIKGSAAVSGAYANPAAAGATSHAFQLFANAGTTFGWVGEWFELIIGNRVFTADEVALIERYLTLRYG